MIDDLYKLVNSPLVAFIGLIGFFWLIFEVLKNFVYLPIKTWKDSKIKEKQALEKKLKKLEFDNIQFKNDILRLDLELKDLKKVGNKK